MKKVEAIIRPEKFDEVKVALEEAGYAGITVTEVQGHGKQKGVTQTWRGRQYLVQLLPKLKLEVVTANEKAAKMVQAVLKAASTGNLGDGKIFVYDVAEAYRISSGEKGENVVL